MSVSFASTGGVAITIQNPDLGDKLDLDPHVVIKPKASGGFYRFALADISDTMRELKWSNLRRSELDDLTDFFEDEAEGSLNEFTFTDERGTSWAAYFLNPTLDPITVSDEAASTGSFESGDATIPTTTRSGGYYELSLRLHLVAGVATTGPPTTPATWPPTTQALTTPGPTEAPTTQPPVPDFIVSAGAGTPYASGEYWNTGGMSGGQPYYKQTGLAAYIWCTSGTWYIGPELGDANTAWYYSLTVRSTPAGSYAANTGASPVPFVNVG